MSAALSPLRLPWKVKTMIAAYSACLHLSIRSDGTVNRSLVNLWDRKSAPLNHPYNGLKSFDLTVDDSRNLWFRLYTPTSASTSGSLPLIVYIHGGGFAFGSPHSTLHDQFCQRLAREIPAVVVSVNYRLAPEHRYPCQYEDAFDVLKYIDANARTIQGFPSCVDLKRCFLAGDSAGGNIAHHAVLRCADHEFEELEIIGLVAVQPFFGGEERTESEIRLSSKAPLLRIDRADCFWKMFLPEGSDRDHPAVNVFGPKAAEISRVRFPAAMVFVGGWDPVIDWQKRYYEGLKKSGKEAYLIQYPNAFHGFFVFPELPEWNLFIKQVTDFVQTRCSIKSYQNGR